MKRTIALFTLIFVLVSFTACGGTKAQNGTEAKGKEPTTENTVIPSSPDNTRETVAAPATEPTAPATEPTAPATEPTAPATEPTGATQGNGTAVKKTADEAKGIAFTHAGVSEADVRDLSVEYDRDFGVESYEIEFDVGATEYEYDIDAYTGEIIKAEKDGRSTLNAVSDEVMLTADEAKAIAFNDAGVSEADVRDLEVDFDRDDGRESYEIDFKVERIEYSYDIDAYTGEILKSEKEMD